ncbi:hypothetical protein LINPERHAP2_LOCUS18994, partial [Linum perenne]
FTSRSENQRQKEGSLLVVKGFGETILQFRRNWMKEWRPVFSKGSFGETTSSSSPKPKDQPGVLYKEGSGSNL